MIIKSDLHIHTSEDREDSFINYSARDIINKASEIGMNVIALTLHRYILPSNEFSKLKKYASSKGILLISGVEAKIEGKHVLIYNITKKEHDSLHSFEDLRTLRKKNKKIFTIAPHPFMPKLWITKNCVQEKYFDNKDLFDALESQFFYTFFMNPNRKTRKISAADSKPMVGNSDLHFMSYFGKNYAEVDVRGDLTEENFFKAIKQGHVRVVCKKNFFDFYTLIIKHVNCGLFLKKTFRS